MVVRNSGDALHNGVAVLLPICQREKNKKHRWGQREQVLQIIRNAVGRRHTISVTDTSATDILSRKETLFDQAIQLQPNREYVVIVCANEPEWDGLRERLKLRRVTNQLYRALGRERSTALPIAHRHFRTDKGSRDRRGAEVVYPGQEAGGGDARRFRPRPPVGLCFALQN